MISIVNALLMITNDFIIGNAFLMVFLEKCIANDFSNSKCIVNDFSIEKTLLMIFL